MHLRPLRRLLTYGTLASTTAFAACVLLQVFARLALPVAPSWTEEAARLCFVLAVGFGAGLALRSREYVAFDFFYRRLPARWQVRLARLSDLLTVALFAVFTVGAVRFTWMGLAERSPTLKFPMALAFASTLVLGVGVLAFAIRQSARSFKLY